MQMSFSATIIEWRGPAPFLFARVPDEECEEIRALAPLLTYGWGVIPARVRIGGTVFTTSLFPREGGYLVPVKVVVQRAEGIGVDDVVEVQLNLGDPD